MILATGDGDQAVSRGAYQPNNPSYDETVVVVGFAETLWLASSPGWNGMQPVWGAISGLPVSVVKNRLIQCRRKA